MIKIKYIFVSASSEFKFSEESAVAVTATRPAVSFAYIKNNKLPLARVYNNELKNGSDGFDYIAFVHADVETDFAALAEDIEKCNGQYDLIGLCGCAKLNVSRSPLNWYCGSIPFPEDRWGCVTHGELGDQCSFFSQHHPDVVDHEVACIDGLCIIMSAKAIDAGLRFDETLGAFSHYDTDISLQAIINYHFKVGVVVRKDLKHYSVGKSILTKQFLADEILFRNKWKIGIPADSPIRGLGIPFPPENP